MTDMEIPKITMRGVLAYVKVDPTKQPLLTIGDMQPIIQFLFRKQGRHYRFVDAWSKTRGGTLTYKFEPVPLMGNK